MNDVTWVPAAGFEGMYEVSDTGDVRSWRVGGSRHKRATEPRLLVLSTDGDGYKRCNLYAGNGVTKNVAVHVLVCASWHGPRPDGAQVRHLNGVRTDNSKDNLKWGTAKENTADMDAHGTRRCRLSTEAIRDIRENTAMSGKALALKYGISVGYAYQIRRGYALGGRS